MAAYPNADPASLTALEIAAAVKSGALTPGDVTAAVLKAIEAGDGRLGAFQVVRADAAVAEAAELTGRADLATLPLAGVPVAVKDNVPVAGEPMRDGSASTSAEPQPADHEVVRRLRAAGAVVVGLTKVPEFCVFGATDSTFGITRNPWDLSRTPGGSSGGSAAAVAGGLVPIALGNDGLGSIRIPAACCGLFGIKPGFGVVPSGLGNNAWYDMAENGPLATTVADAALMLAVLAERPGLAEVAEPDRPLRIAVSLRSPVSGVRSDLEHLRAVVRTARRLEAAGHEISRVDPPYPANPAPALARWFGGASFDADGLDRSLFDPAVRRHVSIGDTVRRRGLVRDDDRVAFRAALAEFFASYDVLLTPVLASPPLAAVRWGERPWPKVAAANARFAPFSAPWNLAQYPAASVPAGLHPTEGTPLSVQLVAPDGGESRLLGLAAQIERLAPWPRTAHA
jgi:amidase